MDQSQSKRPLSDLPETKSEYWEDSECELKKMVERAPHTHYFEKIGREARCQCGFGLFLSAEDNVRDGHLYLGDQIIY